MKDWTEKGQAVVETATRDVIGNMGDSVDISAIGPTVLVMGDALFNTSTGRVRLGNSIIGHTYLYGDAEGDNFGRSLSINAAGDLVAIGGPGPAEKIGYVNIYARTGTIWTIVKTLTGDADSVTFGSSVSLSDDAKYLVVSDPRVTVGLTTPNGKAHIYKNNSGNWNLIQTIVGDGGDRLGTAVDITTGGEFVALGAPNFDLSGRVKVYKNNGSDTYELYQTFVDPSPDVPSPPNNTEYGSSLSIRKFGSDVFLAIGAPDVGTDNPGGIVYLHRVFSGDDDTLLTAVVGDNMGDRFGHSVSLDINDNGDLLVMVGAPKFDTDNDDAGKIYLYKYRVPSDTLTELYTDEGRDKNRNLGTSTVMRFGTFPPPSEVFGLFMAGGPGLNGPVADDGGQVRLYLANSDIRDIADFDGRGFNGFGRSVSISDACDLMMVGTPEFDEGVGGVNVYEYNTNDKLWRSQLTEDFNTFTIQSSSVVTNFGKIVELSGDGKTVAVASDSLVNVFIYDGTSWKEETLPAFDYDLNNGISALSISGDGTVLGVATKDGTLAIFRLGEKSIGLEAFRADPRVPENVDIAISSDGSTAVIATDALNPLDPGDIYIDKLISVYSLNGGATLSNTIILPRNDTAGTRVDTNETGDRFAVGIRAGSYEDEGFFLIDRVYVYELVGTMYQQLGQTIHAGIEISNGIEVEMSDSGDRISALFYNGNAIIGLEIIDPYIRFYDLTDNEWEQVGSDIPVKSQQYTCDTQRNLDMSGTGEVVLAGEPAPEDSVATVPGQVRTFVCGLSAPKIVQTGKYWTNILASTC
jgi:WD40 repeat protein